MAVSKFICPEKTVRLSRGAAYYLMKHPGIMTYLYNTIQNPISANQMMNEMNCTVYEAISIIRKLSTYGILEKSGYTDKRRHVNAYQLSNIGKQWIEQQFAGSLCINSDGAGSAEVSE